MRHMRFGGAIIYANVLVSGEQFAVISNRYSVIGIQ